jgi:predicted transcriptional regulator
LKLKEYLEKHCIQQNAFCEKHDIPIQTFIRAKNGGDIRLSTANKIVEATDGEVEFEDLLCIQE